MPDDTVAEEEKRKRLLRRMHDRLMQLKEPDCPQFCEIPEMLVPHIVKETTDAG